MEALISGLPLALQRQISQSDVQVSLDSTGRDIELVGQLGDHQPLPIVELGQDHAEALG